MNKIEVCIGWTALSPAVTPRQRGFGGCVFYEVFLQSVGLCDPDAVRDEILERFSDYYEAIQLVAGDNPAEKLQSVPANKGGEKHIAQYLRRSDGWPMDAAVFIFDFNSQCWYLSYYGEYGSCWLNGKGYDPVEIQGILEADQSRYEKHCFDEELYLEEYASELDIFNKSNPESYRSCVWAECHLNRGYSAWIDFYGVSGRITTMRADYLGCDEYGTFVIV